MNRLTFALLLALTLGLAPFVPEPHIWKQMKNIYEWSLTEPIDWFDLFLHGTPWAWLIFVMLHRNRSENNSSGEPS